MVQRAERGLSEHKKAALAAISEHSEEVQLPVAAHRVVLHLLPTRHCRPRRPLALERAAEAAVESGNPLKNRQQSRDQDANRGAE